METSGQQKPDLKKLKVVIMVMAIVIAVLLGLLLKAEGVVSMGS